MTVQCSITDLTQEAPHQSLFANKHKTRLWLRGICWSETSTLWHTRSLVTGRLQKWVSLQKSKIKLWSTTTDRIKNGRRDLLDNLKISWIISGPEYTCNHTHLLISPPRVLFKGNSKHVPAPVSVSVRVALQDLQDVLLPLTNCEVHEFYCTRWRPTSAQTFTARWVWCGARWRQPTETKTLKPWITQVIGRQVKQKV